MVPFQTGFGEPDYAPCRYGLSRAVFRGPSRALTGRYLVALGGTATFGKHVAQPFADLIEGATGTAVANLGAQNAGPEFYLSDPTVLAVAARAHLAIIQLGAADGLSNPFYAVHPRRNDRVLGVTAALRGLFPDIDFAEVHFTRHLLTVLHRRDPARFARVAQVLRATWVARMQELLVHLPPRRILLWLAQGTCAEDPLGQIRIDPAMVARLTGPATLPVRITLPLPDGPDAWPPSGAEALLPGPADHRRIADRLLPEIGRMLAEPRRAPLLLRPKDRVG